jgi:hypothetical protein
MTPEEKSIELFKEICKADGEALAKDFEEEYDADKIIEIANGQKDD